MKDGERGEERSGANEGLTLARAQSRALCESVVSAVRCPLSADIDLSI